MIPFNKPLKIGNELSYIEVAINSGKLSGNGDFTKKCGEFFKKRYAVPHALMTTSCTDALEMSAILLGIKEGDEVIMPSYTFVSTANAFLLRGAKIIFVDSSDINPNIDPYSIESLITKKTKAIVVVHYAGIACDMEEIMKIGKKYGIPIIEDAAQAIESKFKNKQLGTIGEFGTFSFHETKNIISGEGGLLMVNNSDYIERSEIIWEKGTNRASFFRGEINKYGWVDLGSSFLPSEIISAYLFAQLENIEKIQNKRIKLWEVYNSILSGSKKYSTPYIPDYASNNAHMYYIVTNNIIERDELISYLRINKIMATFHYQSLHASEFYKNIHDGRNLRNAERYSNCLLRLPLYYDLSLVEAEMIAKAIKNFYSE